LCEGAATEDRSIVARGAAGAGAERRALAISPVRAGAEIWEINSTVAGIEGIADGEARLGDPIAWRFEETAHPGLGCVRPYTSAAMSTIMPSRMAISWRCHGLTRSQ
jgi:hypothetical protein